MPFFFVLLSFLGQKNQLTRTRVRASDLQDASAPEAAKARAATRAMPAVRMVGLELEVGGKVERLENWKAIEFRVKVRETELGAVSSVPHCPRGRHSVARPTRSGWRGGGGGCGWQATEHTQICACGLRIKKKAPPKQRVYPAQGARPTRRLGVTSVDNIQHYQTGGRQGAGHGQEGRCGVQTSAHAQHPAREANLVSLFSPPPPDPRAPPRAPHSGWRAVEGV